MRVLVCSAAWQELAVLGGLSAAVEGGGGGAAGDRSLDVFEY